MTLASQDMPNELPFRPWWWHPNSGYEGRHRGKYLFGKTGKVALPYGIRDVKVRPYIDFTDSIHRVGGFSMPGMVSIGFTETEEAPLFGDDKIITTRGSAKQSWNVSITDVNEDVLKMIFGEKWNSKTHMAGTQGNRWWKRCVTRLTKLSKSIWSMIATGNLHNVEKNP